MKRAELDQLFNQFYKESYRDALYYCMAKTGDFVNTEDILADAYFALYKRMKKAGIVGLKQYFYVVLKNEIASYWKKHRKELTVPLEDENGQEYELLLETDFNITADSAMRNMLVQDILEYISKQPAVMRRAFVIHFYFEKTLEETATELGVTVPNVRNYIYRLLRKVKDEFMDEYL